MDRAQFAAAPLIQFADSALHLLHHAISAAHGLAEIEQLGAAMNKGPVAAARV